MAHVSEDTQPAGRRLLRRGSVFTLANALKIGAAALAIPIATRLLDPSDYGTVTLATTLQLMLATVVALGLPEAILRFYYDERHGETGARALIASSVVVAFVVTSGVAGLVLIAGALGAGETEPLLWGCALALPTAVYGGCMALLRAQERTGAFVLVALTASVGAQALAVVGVILEPVPATYLAGVMVAVAAATITGLVLTGTIGAKPAARATLRAALAYGLPTVPYTASIFALAFADRFVVAAIDGSAAVGQYQVAFAFGFLGVVLVQSLQLAWVPMTFGASEVGRWEMLADLSGTVARLAAFISGFLALAAQPALSVLVPGDYDTDLLAEVAAIAALATVGWSLFMARTQVLLWKRRHPTARVDHAGGGGPEPRARGRPATDARAPGRGGRHGGRRGRPDGTDRARRGEHRRSCRGARARSFSPTGSRLPAPVSPCCSPTRPGAPACGSPSCWWPGSGS